MEILVQMQDFKISDSEPINLQIEKFESLCKKLKDIKETLTEKSKALKLLFSLMPTFSAFCMA